MMKQHSIQDRTLKTKNENLKQASIGQRRSKIHFNSWIKYTDGNRNHT